MANGFQEAGASFRGLQPKDLVGQVRRFGQHGPAYEVLDVRQSGEAGIVVIESGERLDYPIAELLADPVAETVP